MKISPSSLRLGFAGTPRFAVPALEALSGAGHRVVAVYTQPDRPAGRGRTLEPGAVKRCAQQLGIEVRQPRSLKDVQAQQELRALELDVLVVAAYGLILPPAVLALPALGCLNIHASLLPRWRGAAPIQRALLAGDAVTGVTIMQMDAGLDTGGMLARGEIEIAERETGATLHDRLSALGAELIVETLKGLQAGEIGAQPQPEQGATYAAKIDKAEALIDWSEGAPQILRRVRAFNPWPVAETRWQGRQVRIWEAELAGSGPSQAPGTVVAASDAGIEVACGTGTLRIQRLQLAGRKALSAGDFVKGQRLLDAAFGSP